MAAHGNDFQQQAAQADDERRRETQYRQEAQRLILERDQLNNDVASEDNNETASLTGSYASSAGPRAISNEPSQLEAKLRALDEDNKKNLILIEDLRRQITVREYEYELLRDEMDDAQMHHNVTKYTLKDKSETAALQAEQIKMLQKSNNNLQEQVERLEQLVVDNNLVVYPADDEDEQINIVDNGVSSQQNGTIESTEPKKISGCALLGKETVDMLKELQLESLEECIKHLVEFKQRSEEEIKKLSKKLEQDDGSYTRKDGKKKISGDDYDVMKQNLASTKSTNQDYKKQIQLSQQKITSLESDIKGFESKIIRLEGQVKRHKSIAEECEKQEEQSKKDKRKFQKELRERTSEIEDLKSENSSLLKRIDKLTKMNKK